MAIKDYDTAIRLKPSKTTLIFAHVKSANAKLDVGDNIGAIEDYNAAIRLQPKKSCYSYCCIPQSRRCKVQYG